MKVLRSLLLVATFASHSIASSAAPVPLIGAVRIEAGYDFACVLMAAGGVQCWGMNASGQLGNGFPEPFRPMAQYVSGLSSGAAAIGAGGRHACAILLSGGVRCWGDNSSAQLGTGSSGPAELSPVDVVGLGDSATALALGQGHTCALLADKTVKCWGDAKAVGHGAASPQVTPLAIPELAGVASITAGPAHNCAVLDSGAAKCWGKNGAGQLGDGGTTDAATAVDVVGLSSGVAALSAGGSVFSPTPGFSFALDGSFTCARMVSGGLKCFGANKSGQLGAGTSSGQSPTPVDVSGLASGVSQVSAGGIVHGFTGTYDVLGHACVVTSTGALKCWGSNHCGQVGKSGGACFPLIPASVTTPWDVPSLASGVAAVASGGNFTCVLMSTDGAVQCFGSVLDTFDYALQDQYVPKPVMIGRAPQGISLSQPPPIPVGSSTLLELTRKGGSESPVVFASLTPSICSISPTASVVAGRYGATIQGVAQGKCRVTANQAGTAVFEPAEEVTREVRVGDKLPQTIAWTPPTSLPRYNGLGGGAVDLHATASSGLPVLFTSRTPQICGGGTLVFAPTTGLCTLTASQAGDGYFEPAPEVTHSFPIVEPDGDVIRMSNISTRVYVSGSEEAAPIAGFVIQGAVGLTKKVAIVATGPSLATSGVTNPIADPVVTVIYPPTNLVVGSNDNWQDHPRAFQLQAAGLAPPSPLDAAVVMDLSPGQWTARATGKAGGTGVSVIAVYEIDHYLNRLINISTRGYVGAGDNVMIAGFVVSGSGPQQLAIVATGPSLGTLGINDPLGNPTLTLVKSSDQSVIASNDDWQNAPNSAQLQAAGLAPTHPSEAAILVTLPPGAYTAIVSGAGGAAGIAVVGVYAVP